MKSVSTDGKIAGVTTWYVWKALISLKIGDVSCHAKKEYKIKKQVTLWIIAKYWTSVGNYY